MSMLCAISGETPSVPVASVKSGAIFEKRLIEAYISQHGKDPVSGEELEAADLIDLKSSTIVRPRPPTFTSIPALLGVFQSEWDALALETHALRQQMTQVRQELSTALYQYDAATRVITRLTKERDEARDALSRVTVGAGGASAAAAAAAAEQMELDLPQLPLEIQGRVAGAKARLSGARKSRSVPADWTTGDLVSLFVPTWTSEPLCPGTKALSVDETGDLALVGGADGIAGIYSVSEQRLVKTLKSDDGTVNGVDWVGRQAATASSSGVVRLWSAQDNASTAMRGHAGEAVALSVHPCQSLLASAGADKSWVLYDLEVAKSVVQIYNPNKPTAANFHPDGHLFALGTDENVQVFDVRAASLGATLGPLASPVSSMSFSENGYWLALSTQGQATIEIWDLRKMKTAKTLQDAGGRVDCVAWDGSAQFLAAAGAGGLSVQQFVKGSKQWQEPLRSAVPAVAVAWGQRASRLVTADGQGVVSVLAAGKGKARE